MTTSAAITLPATTGRLNVHIDGQEHALESGDSMYFDAGVPHGYRPQRHLNMCASDRLIAYPDDHPTSCRSEARLNVRAVTAVIVRTTDGLEIV